MEDSQERGRRNEIQGKNEVFRIHYQPYSISFDELLILESLSVSRAAKNQWKLFDGLRSRYTDVDVFVKSRN